MCFKSVQILTLMIRFCLQDILQQPVMIILKQEEMRRGINTQSSRVPNPLTDTSSKSNIVIDTPLNLDEFDDSRFRFQIIIVIIYISHLCYLFAI